MFGIFVLILFLFLVVGTLPTWPHSRSWGYKPTISVAIVLIVVVILFMMSRSNSSSGLPIIP